MNSKTTTGTAHGAAVISLPRSQVEMTDWDTQWQERLTKIVRRVAKDLIANDEAEISEVVRRRLFEDLGSERIRRNVAKAFADWRFERRAQLPPEWTAVDTTATEAKAREFLLTRFETCYPFHPALAAGIEMYAWTEEWDAAADESTVLADYARQLEAAVTCRRVAALIAYHADKVGPLELEEALKGEVFLGGGGAEKCTDTCIRFAVAKVLELLPSMTGGFGVRDRNRSDGAGR